MAISMSRKDDCWDSTPMEDFRERFKNEGCIIGNP